MDESKKKVLTIIVCIVCLLIAAVFSYHYLVGKKDNSLDALAGEALWVICTNPQCGVSYEMNKKEYYQELIKESSPNRTYSFCCYSYCCGSCNDNAWTLCLLAQGK